MKISITVKPNAKANEIIRDGEQMLVKVKEPAKEGKANSAVLKVLSEYFGVSQSSIRIINGLSSKHKIIEIRGK